MKVKKKFFYEDVELRIVEREEPYMNAKHTVTMTRVLSPKDKVVPVNFERRATLKSIVQSTTDFLDVMKRRGADVKAELLKD